MQSRQLHLRTCERMCRDVQGNAPPDSWRVMERFVAQANHFLPWGPPVYGEHPLSEEVWAPESPTGSSIEPSHSSAASHSGSRYLSAAHIKVISLAVDLL